jgi:hypothetical protein
MNRTPWVAMGVRCVLWVLVVLGATGCSCEPPRIIVGPPDAAVDDAQADASRAGDADAHVDATSCGSSGSVGSQCRMGACGSTSMCVMDRAATSIRTVFQVAQGTPEDLAHPGYQGVQMPSVPEDDVPFNAWLGSMCVQECDLGATTDGCGACATCSGTLTQNAFVNALGGAGLTFGADALYANSGLCRLSCTFDPATRGDECVGSTTCDAFGETCVEECTSDAECRMQLGITFAGEIVTVVDDASPASCNAATGRCEVPGDASAQVGDACDSGNDCAPGAGVCLRGGLCAELGCTAGSCGGGSGVCLGVNENQTICLAGCNTVADCSPGNACQMLGAAVGGFMGYCLGACEDDSECAATETCTDTVDAMGAVVGGACVPRCTAPGEVGAASGGCATDEFCARDHDGAAYGYCRIANQFCGAGNTVNLAAASDDCSSGAVCDELLAMGGGPGFGGRDVVGDGHCVSACVVDADCTTAGTTCVTSGAYAGLCRQACDGSVPCPTGQICDVGEGRCVEAPPLAP